MSDKGGGFRALFDGLFGTSNQPEPPDGQPQRVALAAAVLMTEVARADFSEAPEEQAVMRRALREQFDLSEADAAALMGQAGNRLDASASSHEDLSTLNNALSYADKLQVLTALWRVAYADGVLEKHEEALMRRFGELLYVPHRDWIRLKLQIAESAAE